MDQESLLDTIRRLLALSRSPNEHEAQAAMAKAQELCLRYNLSLADVAAHQVADLSGWQTISGWQGGATIPLHVHLAAAVVEQFFFVRTILETRYAAGQRSKGLFLFGRAENVAIAQHVLVFLVRTFWELWSRFRVGRSPRVRRHYMLGLALGVAARLASERRAIVTTEARNALVVVDAELQQRFDEAHGDLGKAQKVKLPLPQDDDHGVLALGFSAGRQVTIPPAIELSRKRQLSFCAGKHEGTET